MDIKRVPDEELLRLSEEEGPTSAAAAILHRLRMKWAKEHQVYAWQAGSYYFVGPVPDARTECLIMKFLDEPGQERVRGHCGGNHGQATRRSLADTISAASA